MKKETYDENFNHIVDEAINEYVKKEQIEQDKNSTEKVEYSEIHNQKMKELFEEARKKEKSKILSRTIKYAVAVIAVLAILIISFSGPVQIAFKEKFGDFFISNKSEYSWIVSANEDDIYILDFISGDEEMNAKITFLDYLPNGYKMTIVEDNWRSKIIELNKNEIIINIKIAKSSLNRALDDIINSDEIDNKEVISINDIDILRYILNNSTAYTWEKDDVVYLVYGNADKDIIENIIKGINYKEIKKIL